MKSNARPPSLGPSTGSQSHRALIDCPHRLPSSRPSDRNSPLLLMAVYGVLPVRKVVFPHQVSSFAVGKPSSVALIDNILLTLDRRPGRLDEETRKESSLHLAVALVKEASSSGVIYPVHAAATACRLLEVRIVKPSALRGTADADTAAGDSGPGAVYVIVVQGAERIVLDDEPEATEPYLRMRARRMITHPGLDAENATAWGLTLQGLAHELLRGLQLPSALVDTREAASAITTTIKEANSLLAVSSGSRCFDVKALSHLADGLAGTRDHQPSLSYFP